MGWSAPVEILVLDFGRAKQVPPVGSEATVTGELTVAGSIPGAVQYMSPEQLQGKPVDARSDLFSFGCVLYEMLTGKRAFEGDNPASVRPCWSGSPHRCTGAIDGPGKETPNSASACC